MSNASSDVQFWRAMRMPLASPMISLVAIASRRFSASSEAAAYAMALASAIAAGAAKSVFTWRAASSKAGLCEYKLSEATTVPRTGNGVDKTLRMPTFLACPARAGQEARLSLAWTTTPSRSAWTQGPSPASY